MPIGNPRFFSNPELCPSEVQVGDQSSAALRASGVFSPFASRLSFLLFSLAECGSALTAPCLIFDKIPFFFLSSENSFIKPCTKTGSSNSVSFHA